MVSNNSDNNNITNKMTDNNVSKFTLKNTTYQIANSIRRAATAEINVYAFDNFVIEKNNTCFTDEYITHRLALIPIKNDIVNPDKLPKFTFDVSGKLNETIEVWSDQIVSDDKVKYIDNNTLILYLKGNNSKVQDFKVSFDLVLGTGNQHTKWKPVCVVFYEPLLKDKTTSDLQDFALTIEGRDVFADNKTILSRAFDVLIGRLQVIINSIDNQNKIKFTNLNPNFNEIMLFDENDTIGNPLTVYMRNLKNVDYVGYTKTHPLEKQIMIKITSTNAPQDNLKNACNQMINHLLLLSKNIN
jgi:DNA-directed RNA polymerase subunit L